MEHRQALEVAEQLADDVTLGRYPVVGDRHDREQSAALLAVMLDRLYPERAPHRWSFNPNGYKYSGAPRL
jgi:hypothetical protein